MRATVVAAAFCLALPAARGGEAPGMAALPPLPEGVTELDFRDFFRLPVGSRGLEPTEELRSLAGRRVRILGYMVEQDAPTRGRLLLAPFRMKLHESEYGQADDLPPTTLFVFLADEPDAAPVYTPGSLLLTGTLDVGVREEVDGRTSTVRLHVRAPQTHTSPRGETP